MSYLNRLSHLVSDFLDKTAAKPKIKYTKFDDGIVINADCCEPETFEFVKKYLDGKKIQLLLTDPPYGNIVSDKWDRTKLTQEEFSDWMKSWLKLWVPSLQKGAGVYIWGGTGVPKFRPFFYFCSQIEHDPELHLVIKNYITHKKKRFFGTKDNYGYAREECVFCIYNSDKPCVFNIPLTDIERGYSGFGKYKAKSKFLRRTNIWDQTELFSGKLHPTEKNTKVLKIPIEASSNKGSYCLDLFGGSGSTAAAARECGRKFIIIEKDPTYYKNIIKRLNQV